MEKRCNLLGKETLVDAINTQVSQKDIPVPPV